VHVLQESLHAIEERKKVERFTAKILVSFEVAKHYVSVVVEDNGLSSVHDYEMNNSISAAVTKMILEEHGGGIELGALENKNMQKLYLARVTALEDISL